MAKQDQRDFVREHNLYSSFYNLKKFIEDSSDLYSIIGYSVLFNLFNFKNISKFKGEGKKFEEVKFIYSGLKSVKNQLLSSTDEDAPYLILSTLKKDVHNELSDLISAYDSKSKNLFRAFVKKKYSSELLRKMISSSLTPAKKNYVQLIKNNGSSLYQKVMDESFLIGNRNILLHDYSSIYEAFCK